MTGRAWFTISLGAALAVVGCSGSAIPARDLLLEITPSQTEVDSGRAFTLTVVRVWQQDLEPKEWDDEALRPLTVSLVGTARVTDELRVKDTRTYRGYAFGNGTVEVPPIRFVATPKTGGVPHTVTAPPLSFRVRSSLDAGTAGPVELPGEPVPEPSGQRTLLLAAAVTALVAFGVTARARRRRLAANAAPMESPRSTTTPADAALPTPAERALAEIDKVAARQSDTDAAVARDAVDIGEIVRVFAREAFSLRTREMTSHELLAAIGGTVSPVGRALLARFLERLDGVKFARSDASSAVRHAVIDSARAFVSEASAASALPHAVTQ